MRVSICRVGQLTLHDIRTALDYYDVVIITDLPGYTLTSVLPNGVYYVDNQNQMLPANNPVFLRMNNLLRNEEDNMY